MEAITSEASNVPLSPFCWLVLKACLGSYKGCWSWFEASILRPDKDTGVYSEISVNGSQRFHVQNNVHISRNYDTHEIEWTEDDGGDDDRGGHGGTGRGAGVGFVRALRPGDKIALIAMAQVRT